MSLYPWDSWTSSIKRVHQVKKELINNNAVNLQWLEEMGGRNKASFQQTYCFVISDFILQSKNWKLSYIMFHMQVWGVLASWFIDKMTSKKTKHWHTICDNNNYHLHIVSTFSKNKLLMGLAVQKISMWGIDKILKLWSERTNHIGGTEILWSCWVG